MHRTMGPSTPISWQFHGNATPEARFPTVAAGNRSVFAA